MQKDYGDNYSVCAEIHVENPKVLRKKILILVLFFKKVWWSCLKYDQN